MPPSVSIVTPVWKPDARLQRTLVSVAEQVGVAWEHVLVGPRDPGCEPLPAGAAGSRRWIAADGRNSVELVNAGLRASQGEVVAWLNPGDVYYRDTLRVVVEAFAEQPQADVVFGDAVLFDSQVFPRGRYRTKRFSLRRLRKTCCLCQPAVFLKQSTRQRQGELDATLNYWSDYEYWLRLVDAGARFERTPQLLAGVEVPEETGVLHLGPFARDVDEDAVTELNALFKRRLGRVPARWLVHAARLASNRDPAVRPYSLPHFLATLRHARAEARNWGESAWGAPGAWLLLPWESARSEWKRLRCEPQPLRRLIPVDKVSREVQRLSGQVRRASSGVREAIVKQPQRLAKGVAASASGAALTVNSVAGGVTGRLAAAASSVAEGVQNTIHAACGAVVSGVQAVVSPWVARGRQLAAVCVANSKRRIFKLKNYEPRPLQVPAWYLRTQPPPNAPVISIVTPNLNQGSFIEATIRSVLDQHYPATEYIVQDGGSKDESLDVIRRYGARLKHWASEKDSGQTNAINRGMRHATGEIMAYLNSDDILLPGSLACVAQFFATHPEVDVVYGHRVLIDDDGLDIGRWVLPPHDNEVLPFADYVPQETMFWRRRIWDRVGGQLDESFHFAMDWDLILRFREAGARFHRLPRFLGAFRVSRDNKTTKLLETVGRRDMEILRKRVLGRIPSDEEIHTVIRPYLWRHWVYDKLYMTGVLRY